MPIEPPILIVFRPVVSVSAALDCNANRLTVPMLTVVVKGPLGVNELVYNPAPLTTRKFERLALRNCTALNAFLPMYTVPGEVKFWVLAALLT